MTIYSLDVLLEVGSQEIPGVTGKFGLGAQNEAGQRLTRILPRECTNRSKHSFSAIQKTTLRIAITILVCS